MTFLDELSEITDELDKLSAKFSPKEATLLKKQNLLVNRPRIHG